MHSCYFESKISELQEDNNIKDFLDQIMELGPSIIVGGALRDWVFKLSPKDIDIVIDCPSTDLKFISNNHKATSNVFGGYKVNINSISLDVWSLDTTWAFRNDTSLEQSLNNIINTFPFNFDAISYNLQTKTILGDLFFKGLSSKTLDFVYKSNPFPFNLVSKAICMAQKYDLNFSDRIQDYISEQISLGYNKIHFMKYQDSNYGKQIYNYIIK